MKTRYHHFPNAGTVAVVDLGEGLCAIGVATKHPADQFDRSKGRVIAEGRAKRQRVTEKGPINCTVLVNDEAKRRIQEARAWEKQYNQYFGGAQLWYAVIAGNHAGN